MDHECLATFHNRLIDDGAAVLFMFRVPGGRKRGRWEPRFGHVGPNMTPMVDVTMVILIFFMLGSSFASRAWYLTNNIPAIKGGLANTPARAMPATRLEIRLRQRGNHTMAIIGVFQTEDLSGRLLRWLLEKKKLLGKKTQVLLVPGNDVPYQNVLTVYSDCIQAKFRHVAFGLSR